MTENELIKRLTANLPTDETVVVGTGDDCAVLNIGDHMILYKTDATVEGVHFKKNTIPELIGHKALARPLSDIAAMGGTPTHSLITLGTNPEITSEYIERLYEGLKRCAEKHNVNIVGGETTTLTNLTLSICLLGAVENPITRVGSKAGDAIFVSGELGGSIIEHHLNFTPRLEQGRWLAKEFDLHAMIDLSDGLATDLHHLLGKNLGADLLASAIPISNSAKLRAKEAPSGKTALLAALTDGEDYELLFTLPGKDAIKLHDAWKEKFPDLSLKCIGKITGAPGIILRDKKTIHTLTAHGYDHLQKP